MSQVGGYVREIFYLPICLFCVWKDYLSVLEKVIDPITFRGQLKISHLFFADDIFLFSKAKIIECHNLKNILQKFCQCSSQIISTQKSHLWFSPNTPRRTKDLIVGIFNISTTSQVKTSLGTPIFTTSRKASAYQYLVDKIQKKIEGWQVKYLFVEGRVTLINSTLASIPIHVMQTTLLLQKISRHPDKLNCKFLWGDTTNHKHCHIVRWETITSLKDAGGLGIKSTRHMNVALLMN